MIGYPINDKYSIEFSLQGASASSERTSQLLSNTGGVIHTVPVIDGQSFGHIFQGNPVKSDQQVLFIIGSPDANRNLRTKLDYETWYVDTFLGLDRTVLKKTNTELHGIVGLAYAHFDQDFEHEITGTHILNGIHSSSVLDEDLRDNLFGVKGGLRLNCRVTKRFQIEGSVLGGAYYRKSKLEAGQTLKNLLIGGQVGGVYYSAFVNDHDSHFVRRAEGNLKVKYKINDRWGLSFSSGVDAWWRMSKVNNPMSGSSNFTGTSAPIDRRVHIGDDDRLMDYHASFAITLRHSTLPLFTTAQDISEELTAQKNPYKDAFFGSFDKDMRKDRIDKAVVSVPTRIIGAPYRALCGLGATVQRTDHTIVYGTDEQKDSGFVIAGRAVLSPFIYLGHMVTGAGKYVKENPVQAVIDAATLIGIGVGISEATDDKRTNSSTGRMKTPIPDPDPGGGAPPME